MQAEEVVRPAQKTIDLENMFLKLAELKKKAKMSQAKCYINAWK
jgi:hypothetical protein